MTALSIENKDQEIPPYSIELISVDVPFGKNARGSKLENNFGEISTTKPLLVEGKQNDLLPTFTDKEASFTKLRHQIPELLFFVQETYGLELISPDNCEVYRDQLNEHISYAFSENIDVDEAVINQKVLLDGFIYIYENDEVNQNILDYLFADDDFKIEELAMQLPVTTPLFQEYEKEFLLQPLMTNEEIKQQRAQVYDKKKGNAYAVKHAANPNQSTYGYFSNGDCTNFVSQILRSGIGYQHDKFPNVEQGWWHKNVPFVGHKYSRSWTNVSKFRSFMGSTYSTKRFLDFSKTLQKDDFIGLDFWDDGIYDHMGYVTNTGTLNWYKYQNGTKYYKDFVVAQHTSNYNAWVSTTANSWEGSDVNGRYCIARRNV